MFNILLAGMALFVLFGAVCRLDVIQLAKHKFWWGAMYVCYAGTAAACALQQADEAMFFGLASCVLNLILTKHLWEFAPPPSVER